MGNTKAFINGRQYPRSDVTILIAGVAQAVDISGIDYTDGASASLHLATAGEAQLVSVLGPDHFDRSFDISVTYAASSGARLIEDRLVDCRVKGTGYRPMPVSVMFVQRSAT
jgi:hypothetical protein